MFRIYVFHRAHPAVVRTAHDWGAARLDMILPENQVDLSTLVTARTWDVGQTI